MKGDSKFERMWTAIHDFPSGQLNSSEHHNKASEENEAGSSLLLL